ncbi:MAG: GNAT family N-acetyltransferase [Bacillota bacterium]|nr:GNAT family N-acetyltransferase [Bacillota bacterium]
MKVQLRELEEKDAVGMYEWMSDPTIVCFFRFDASHVSIDSCKAFIKKAKQDVHSKHFAIVDETDWYMGTISLKNINDKDAEYAISTRKCVHGTGVAKQASEQILKMAFEELGLEKVYLNVLANNTRANAFYKKIGFVFTRKEENAFDGKDLNWYEILKENYGK